MPLLVAKSKSKVILDTRACMHGHCWTFSAPQHPLGSTYSPLDTYRSPGQICLFYLGLQRGDPASNALRYPIRPFNNPSLATVLSAGIAEEGDAARR